MSTPYDLESVNPLTEKHLEDINKALDLLKVGMQQADLASRVGLDVSKHVENMRSMQKQLESIKQVYFPGR